MPPAFNPSPEAKRAALSALADGALALPGIGPLERLWLRDALRAWLRGEAQSLDQALGIPPRQRRQAAAAERAALLRQIAAASGLTHSPWACAGWVAGVISGVHEAPSEVAATASRLRDDPSAARSVRQVYRVLIGGMADTKPDFVSATEDERC